MSRDSVAVINKSKGPGPSAEAFAAAVRELESRQEKLTVRSIEAIAGGTRSVTMTLLREYREQRQAAHAALELPEDFVEAAKRLMATQASKAESAWQVRHRAAQVVQLELEGLIHEAEQRADSMAAALEDSRLRAATADAMLEAEKTAHAKTQAQLAAALAELASANHSAARLAGELDGALMVANSHSVELAAQRKLAAELQARIESVARENERLKSESALLISKSIEHRLQPSAPSTTPNDDDPHR